MGAIVGTVVAVVVAVVVAGGLEKLDRANNWSGFHPPVQPRAGDGVIFGSDTKSTTKLERQMLQRGWTESTVRDTISAPYTTRTSVNQATLNPATVYYNAQGGYVIIDDVTKVVVQVSDNFNPSTWFPDPSIIDPFVP